MYVHCVCVTVREMVESVVVEPNMEDGGDGYVDSVVCVRVW
jgi:hypothetical protein